MFQEKPYFMENEKWYSHNEKKFMYELTAEAPLEAIDSYYYFYAAFDYLEVENIEASFKNEKEKIDDFSKYLKESFNNDEILEILKKLVLNNMISKKYFLSIIPEFDDINIQEDKIPLYSLDYDFNILQANDMGLETKIEEIDFSVRTHNALVSNNILTLNDLMKIEYSEIVKIRNLGRKSLDEICKVLSNYSFVLKNKNLSTYWMTIPEHCKKELIQNSLNNIGDISDLLCEEFIYNYDLNRDTIRHVIHFFVENQIRFRNYEEFDDSSGMIYNDEIDNNIENLDFETIDILYKANNSILILNCEISLLTNLVKNGIYTINDLLKIDDYTMLKGIGKKNKDEIIKELKKISIGNEIINEEEKLIYFNEYDSISNINISNKLFSHFIYNKIYTVKQLLSLNQSEIHLTVYLDPKCLIELLKILRKIRTNNISDITNIQYHKLNLDTTSISILEFKPNICDLLISKKYYCINQLLQLDIDKIQKKITTKQEIVNEIIKKINELKARLQFEKNNYEENNITGKNVIIDNVDDIENTENKSNEIEIEDTTDNSEIIDKNNMLIDTLDLSKKAIKVLNNRKVYTVADLLKFDRIRLKFICGLGKEDVNQILRVIDNLLEIEETVNKDDDVEHENGKKDDIIDFFNQFKK